jgi:hypothetical protein
LTLTVTTDRILLKQTILAWLAARTGIPAERWIWANQRTPRPKKPYGTVFFPSGFVKVGIDEQRREFNEYDEILQKTTTGPRTLTAQIEVYTDPATKDADVEAMELLENAIITLDTDAVRDAFTAAKIGIISQGSPQALDEQLGERWERRAMCEVVFSYSGESFDDGSTGESGNWIETVQVPTEANDNADYGT